MYPTQTQLEIFQGYKEHNAIFSRNMAHPLINFKCTFVRCEFKRDLNLRGAFLIEKEKENKYVSIKYTKQSLTFLPCNM